MKHCSRKTWKWGLKMIAIQSFMSLKASWVSRLVSNQLVHLG